MAGVPSPDRPPIFAGGRISFPDRNSRLARRKNDQDPALDSGRFRSGLAGSMLEAARPGGCSVLNTAIVRHGNR
jgi:hypothetical protein